MSERVAANMNSPRLGSAMRALQSASAHGVAFVPRQPSDTMIAAGAAAGGVDVATAQSIYAAMLAADGEGD